MWLDLCFQKMTLAVPRRMGYSRGKNEQLGALV